MKAFQAALLSAIDKAQSDFGIRQARLKQNIETYGAVAAVKDYIRRNRTSDGFDALVNIGHVELTAEAVVTKHHELFEDEEVNFCFSVLCGADYYKR